MRPKILAMVVALVPTLAATAAADAGVEGLWRTESDENGGYLYVTIAPCASDAAKTCGTISNAFAKSGEEDKTYVNLGKPIVSDMEPDGDDKFKGGTIWDPSHDKVYKSHMTLKGDHLDVEGCVSIICVGQDWKRVQ